MDLRSLHRRVLDDASDVVRGVAEPDLQRPTPCAAWTLGELLAHMVGQHVGFAAAVRDGDAPPSAYAPTAFTPQAWDDSVANLLDAFAAADLDATVVEIELAPTPLPVSRLVAAQFLDTVVHTWDVARSLDLPFEPSGEVADLVARIADGIPDDERRLGAGAAFAPARTASDGTWQHALARLGRDPSWQPATGGVQT
jgi:uncharacterized protein (TIGR03086 family)